MTGKPVYDNYEISGCRSYTDGAASFVEQCDDGEAEFWTLYGHVNGQGVEAIGDFSSREAAEDVYSRITGQPFTGSDGPDPRLRLMHAAPDLLARLWATIPFMDEHASDLFHDGRDQRAAEAGHQTWRMVDTCAKATG